MAHVNLFDPLTDPDLERVEDDEDDLDSETVFSGSEADEYAAILQEWRGFPRGSGPPTDPFDDAIAEAHLLNGLRDPSLPVAPAQPALGRYHDRRRLPLVALPPTELAPFPPGSGAAPVGAEDAKDGEDPAPSPSSTSPSHPTQTSRRNQLEAQPTRGAQVGRAPAWTCVTIWN